MKNDSPHEIARKISIYIYLVITITVLPLVLYYTNGWIPLFVFAVVMIVVFYAIWRVIHYNIEYFVYRRIKLIYKNISRLKADQWPQEQLDFNTDIIGDVSKNVVSWAQESKNEISQLKAQAEFRKEFIGNLAHELRTPAFNMQGFLLTLLEGGLDDPNINERYLQKADKNLDRLIELINDLDKISKLEAGVDNLELSSFNVSELAADVIEEQEERAKEAKVQLVLKPNNANTQVQADKAKIAQVFTNLITNSIRYGVENGSTTISFHDMADRILVEVEDNGIGISENNLPRLFERFYRVDKSRDRNSGGSGLGLAIVKHIMDAHQQSLNVRSTVGEGSVFSFTLSKA